MPHHGQYEHVKEWLQDHDAAVVDESPPVQNTWYELFHAYDVRLLIHRVFQRNDDVVAKDLEVRWTIDGNVYFTSLSLDDDSNNYIFRNEDPSSGGTDGLNPSAATTNVAYHLDKRGLDFKVEVRMTSVPGTNQRLYSTAVYETLEVT